MKYYPRIISEKITHALHSFPVIVLAGARQTGKSTLLKNEPSVKDRPYFSCDDPQVLLSLKASAEAFLQQKPCLNLDEAQRFPQLFLDLKRIVDEKRDYGRFIISGSAQFLLLRNLGDSLAGRAGYIRLLPVSLFEHFKKSTRPFLYRIFEENNVESIFTNSEGSPWSDEWLARGGYPEPCWNTSIDMRLWFAAYEATYLERDLRELASNIDPLAYQRFLRIAASRNGLLLNQANIAQASGLNNVTCGRYIHILETSGLASRVYPFQGNVSKRWVKSPKLLFTDTALAAHLAGIYQALVDDKHPQYGQLFESFVLQNLVALTEAYVPGNMLVSHLRSASGFEIDAIVECNGIQIGIEVKSAKTIGPGDDKILAEYMTQNPACRLGIIAYRGTAVLPLGKRIWAVPVGTLLT